MPSEDNHIIAIMVRITGMDALDIFGERPVEWQQNMREKRTPRDGANSAVERSEEKNVPRGVLKLFGLHRRCFGGRLVLTEGGVLNVPEGY